MLAVERRVQDVRRGVAAGRGAAGRLARRSRAGEVVALEGPSGSGKTTLLSIMGCILTPDRRATIAVAGETVRSDRPAQLRDVRRRSIGFVFQQYNLFPALDRARERRVRAEREGRRRAAARTTRRRARSTRVGLGDRLHFLPARPLGRAEAARGHRPRAGRLAARCCWPTSRPRTSTPRSARRCSSCSASSRSASRRACVIVTHDPKVRDDRRPRGRHPRRPAGGVTATEAP